MIEPNFTSPEFSWGDSDFSTDSGVLLSLITPPLSATDPDDGTFPQAAAYTLQPTRSYTRGFTYNSPWSSEGKAALKQRLLVTRIPPHTQPSRSGVKLHVQPIPGMIQLVPGVPFVQSIDGENVTTVACLHTTASLCHYSAVAQQVRELTQTLCELTFGVVRDGKVVLCPIYTLSGLRRNDRSAKVTKGYNGSYNLASTVMKGDGKGCFLPAAQAPTAEALERINKVTSTLHHLGRIVLRHSISKFEWDLFEFICTVNNVVGFGGFDPNGTGLQMNVSSGFNSLADLIGEHQGGYHSDRNDDYMLWTVLTLLFRLPEGASCYLSSYSRLTALPSRC